LVGHLALNALLPPFLPYFQIFVLCRSADSAFVSGWVPFLVVFVSAGSLPAAGLPAAWVRLVLGACLPAAVLSGLRYPPFCLRSGAVASCCLLPGACRQIAAADALLVPLVDSVAVLVRSACLPGLERAFHSGYLCRCFRFVSAFACVCRATAGLAGLRRWCTLAVLPNA